MRFGIVLAITGLSLAIACVLFGLALHAREIVWLLYHWFSTRPLEAGFMFGMCLALLGAVIAVGGKLPPG